MPHDAKLIAVGVFSPFFVPLKVLVMTAVLLALPWLMYQLWMFVAPGLYSHEKKFALPLIFFGSCWRTRASRSCSSSCSTRCSASFSGSRRRQRGGYAGHRFLRRGHFVSVHCLRRGVPGADRGHVAGAHSKWSRSKSFGRFAAISSCVAFVVAAVLTPPDVISQLSLAIPMCLLYEVGILGCALFRQEQQGTRRKHGLRAAVSATVGAAIPSRQERGGSASWGVSPGVTSSSSLSLPR